MHDASPSADESAAEQHVGPHAHVDPTFQLAASPSSQQGAPAAAISKAQQPESSAAQPLLISSGADGQIRLWQSGAEGLLQRPCPEAWSSPSLEKDKAFHPLGVAVSGNGLVLAVAVDNGTSASAAVQ